MSEPPASPVRAIRVLLVEDHETVRDGLRLLIGAQPDMAVVGEAADGKSAIASVQATGPDVVILDLSIPGMNGLTTAEALRSAATTRIVVLTRHDDRAYVQAVTAAGAAGYVLKQSPSRELLRAIRTVASGGEYFDPALPAPDDGLDPRRRTSTPAATKRELEVLRLSALGHSNKEISARLEISIKTVEVHKANAMRKLNLRGRNDVVKFAVMKEWLRET
jgi:DNA-binding NarL/FixJ family response regulator